MITAIYLALLLGCVLASALYSGSEIGFYSLSRVRVGIEARRGLVRARVVERLQRDDSALLITILIGNNLVIECATHLADGLLAHSAIPARWNGLVLTLCLTPILFLFGEALPKEIFRRRPHRMVLLWAPFILISRILFWPLERVLRLFTALLERVFRPRSGSARGFLGHEVLLSLLAESKRSGALSERAESLAQNALTLRSIPISRAMVPWEQVVRLEATQSRAEWLEIVSESTFSRLPVMATDGSFEGYVHQLEVLAGPDASQGKDQDPFDHLRSLTVLSPETPVDRALLILRGSGQRALIVGTREAPVGLVTLKDLVEEITGDLAAW
ncbi:MAG: putative hemolysin [Chlamydiales bacterium]|jgi:putative hemolysin